MCDIFTPSSTRASIVFSRFGRRIKKLGFPAVVTSTLLELDGQSCCAHRDREMLNSVSSSSSSSLNSDDLLYPFHSTEAHRLYWAGRLRLSIDLLNSQSQLDLVGSPYPSLRHRSRSLFNISQDRPPPRPTHPKEKQTFSNGPKRPPKVINLQ